MIKVTPEQAKEILGYLLANGGEQIEAPAAHELWRVRFSDAIVTYYSNGTLSFVDRALRDPAVIEALEFIQDTVGPFYEPPTRRYLIGLDEAGKGEMFGHIHLAGVMIDKAQYKPFMYRFLNVDTKKGRLILDNWNKLSSNIFDMGARVEQDSIPPWDIDRYNVNELLDITYQRILNRFFRKAPISEARIVIDDYGIGPTLRRFLNFLDRNGAEVVVSSAADERYLESKLASIIARTEKERLVHAINTAKEFEVDGKRPASGNTGDSRTLAWLEAWPHDRELPWFVRRSWKTVAKYHPHRALTGKKKKPSLDSDLLSEEFRNEFDSGRFDIHSLSIICPHCGVVSKECKLVFDGVDSSSLRCPNCGEQIPLLANTLRYYCGHAVVDANALIRKVVSRDLSKHKGRVLRDYRIHVPFVAKVEAGNQKELNNLQAFHRQRRIRFTVGGPEEVTEEKRSQLRALSSDERDELILDICEQMNAIVITADTGMKSRVATRGLFCISTI